jgi:hypothetical protein
VLSKDELSREAAVEQGAELAAEALLEKFQDQAEAEGVQLFAEVRLIEDAWSGTPPLGPKPLVTSSQQSVPQVGLQSASAQLAPAAKTARPLSARSARSGASDMKSRSVMEEGRSPEREGRSEEWRRRQVEELLRLEQMKTMDLQVQLEALKQAGLQQHRRRYAGDALIEALARFDVPDLRNALNSVPAISLGESPEVVIGRRVCSNCDAAIMALREAIMERSPAQVAAWLRAAPLLGVTQSAILDEARALLASYDGAVRDVVAALEIDDPAILLSAVQAFDEHQWAEEPSVLREARRTLAGLPGVSGIAAFDAAVANKRVQAVQGMVRTFGTAQRTAGRFLDRYNAALAQLATAESSAESLAEFEQAGWCQLDAHGERVLRAAREMVSTSTPAEPMDETFRGGRAEAE